MVKTQIDDAHKVYMRIYARLAIVQKTTDERMIDELGEEVRIGAIIAAQDIKFENPIKSKSEFKSEVERLLK